jgi:hypothetical protein
MSKISVFYMSVFTILKRNFGRIVDVISPGSPRYNSIISSGKSPHLGLIRALINVLTIKSATLKSNLQNIFQPKKKMVVFTNRTQTSFEAKNIFNLSKMIEKILIKTCYQM